jgi:hypothetical protein
LNSLRPEVAAVMRRIITSVTAALLPAPVVGTTD